jgi:acyl carrier protein
MEEKIKKILINALEISEDEFTSAISMQNNVAWTSLSQLRVIVDLEELFNIKFTDNEMIKLTSYLNILNTIKNKSAHKNSR